MRAAFSRLPIVVAAALLAGCASSAGKAKTAEAPKTAPAAGTTAKPGTAPASGAAASKPAETKPAAGTAPASTKPAETRPAAGTAPASTKPAEAKPAAGTAPAATKPAETKPADAKAAGAPAAGSAEPRPGMWASMDRWMEAKGETFKEARILGMQIRPWFRETLSYSDNIFYQERNEKLVVNNDPGPAIDPTPGPATPLLGKPRGQVSDFVNTLGVGFGLEKPLNVTLLKAIGASREGGNSYRILDASATWVEYLTETSGPDALNWSVKADIPNLIDLTNLVSKLLRMDAHSHAVYFRLETGYSRTTDPLDVASFGFGDTIIGGNPSPGPILFKEGERNDFTRQEWYVKPTLGFQGPAWDWALSYRYFSFQVLDDALDVADHVEHDFSATLGRSIKAQRIYGYDRYAIFKFESRGPNDETPILRNFVLNEIGMGWEGPLGVVSKKLSGTVELGWCDQDVEDEHTPPFVTGKTGGSLPFDEHHGLVGRFSLTYKPFVTKPTFFKIEYDRHVDWSVVSTNKVVDTGIFTFSHPFNPKFRTEWKYTLSHETVATREKRLYQEADVAFMYQIMHYTELEFRYTYRKMISTGEPTTAFADINNQVYFIQPDGDFTANIFTIGISVSF